jgi:CDP-diacylglycerol---glycerol-3-phosphate 3-phosphatidyltransferase
MNMNFPNLLTLLRVLIIPGLVAVILSKFQGQEYVAFGLFCLATFTDTLDGFWARRLQQITTLGQLLDPIADKLLMASVFICLVETGAVKAWMAVIIIGRELAVTGFRAIAASRGVSVPASLLGKAKMILETIVLAILLLGDKVPFGLFPLGPIGLWLVLVAAVLSAAEYFIRFSPKILSSRP